MIRYSHAMTCLMAYHNKKRTEAICIVLQASAGYVPTLNPANNGFAKFCVENLTNELIIPCADGK
jgi:hypothetical protein